MHEATLIATIAVCFVSAAVLGYIANYFRLPPLVGYLIAGAIVGPFTPCIEANAALAQQLAQIGVILLMFGVGLHFSMSDLLAVRGIAIPGAIFQIVLTVPLGMGLAMLWGWGIGAGVVLGLSLSIASTVVQLKALEQHNQIGSPAGRAAIGWLIVEDLATVLALVLLPILATVLATEGDGASGGSIAVTILTTLAKVTVFGLLAIILGPKIVPFVLTKVARTGSRELFTLSVLALAIGIAYGASTIFGVSFELGAFLAGLVLGESSLGQKAAAQSLPLQDAFSVLFFVSVGMLFDPRILINAPLSVLAILVLIMLVRSLIVFGVILALRYPVSMALTMIGGRAQIGEFSFILAGLGVSLKLLPPEGYNLVLAGAILSIMFNPLAIYGAGELQKRFRAHWPEFFTYYGRQRFQSLVDALARNRARQEERERARHVKIQALLDTIPVLALVEPNAQEELFLLFQPLSASPGERVIRAGDRANGMYFITTGAVEVIVGGRAVPLAAGSFFGEMALLSGSRRTADVIAVDFCEFLLLERHDFNQFMARHPTLRDAVHKMAKERIEANRAHASEAEKQDEQKPDEVQAPEAAGEGEAKPAE